jgi:hypothetical protein
MFILYDKVNNVIFLAQENDTGSLGIITVKKE